MKHKIILKNQDKTKDIERYELVNGNLQVKFKNQSKIYSYTKENFRLLEIERLSLGAQNTLEYFRQIALKVGLKSDEGEKSLLGNEYEKIPSSKLECTKGESQNALFTYLDTNSKITTLHNDKPLLFPFGSNLSQFEAVKNALTSQISIIEGPPGTGKTQTILNIIANLLYRDRVVAVVSNNNSAIQNVLEKLANFELANTHLDCICALLGKKENKENFIANQSTKELEKLRQTTLDYANSNDKSRIDVLNQNLQQFFILQNSIAQDNALLSKLEMEFAHFKKQEKISILPKVKNLSKLNPQALLYDKTQILESRKISFWLKLKLIFFRGIGNFRFYKNAPFEIIKGFEYVYYECAILQLKDKIHNDKKSLDTLQKQDILTTLKTLSKNELESHLVKRYSNLKITEFSQNDLFAKYSDFITQYPVIFSTTHSISNALNPKLEFDYLICDEASQVDLATGALALSMAKNIIIVGDTKQLPNVITEAIKPQIQALNTHYKISPCYDYLAHCFLSSICARFDNVPKVLLREHYRCHPKIIEFCNQKFYDNKLIILSEDSRNSTQMEAIYLQFTSQGNHARGRHNQREIDEILSLLPSVQKHISDEQIGIITPYNEQKQALQNALGDSKIQVDTVHKFQGREKDAIIISVVNNEISDFVDNPQILNVAITRAKKHLILVVSPNFEHANSHIGDLIKYIQYNNFAIKQGSVKSIFDLLYKQNYEARQKYLKNKRKISVYDSENIAFVFLTDMLQKYGFANLSLACHIPLLRIIGDMSRLDERERKYAQNPRTHIDFVVYHKMDKKPRLTIEIDGYAFHNAKNAQSKRDELKNAILAKYDFTLLRLSTIGSGEEERVINALHNCIKTSSDEK